MWRLRTSRRPNPEPGDSLSPEDHAPDRRPLVIWLVNQYAGSPAHGMEFRHYELGRQLAALGHQVVVVSGSFSHLFTSPPTIHGAYTFESIDGVSYCWVKVPAYRRPTSLGRVINMAVFAARLYRLPIRHLARPDAIVVSSPSPFPILPAGRWAKRFGARLIFEVRDIWPLTLQELGGLSGRHPLVILLRWFERRAYRDAERVVSVLPEAGSYLERHGVPADRIAVIQNGISPEALSVQSRSVPPAIQTATSRPSFNVGFVGTLGVANALETLVDAARLVADEGINVVIVGHGSDEARLRERASDLPNVIFVGPVSKADVPGALQAFDACYVGYHRSPLYRFGISPNKLFDYMAAGRPVILAAAAANDPVGEGGCGITVPPDDPPALADAFRQLRDMPTQERDRLGANGRAFVQREHSYAALARRFASVIAADPS
jgi:glycosyltransferase involved in cell wall biosynthesis